MSTDTLEKFQKIMAVRQNIPEQYFEAEVRDGFHIESKMKRAWAAQIEVLLEIERICKKYGLEYFAYSGTLLGAVRHNGFIPWDEDMDIAMLRDDYQKFLQVAKIELPQGWRLMGAAQGTGIFFSRILNEEGYNSTAEHLLRFHGCPYPVGIDIFPLDFLPDNQEEEDVLYYMLRSVYNAMGAIMTDAGQEILEERLHMVEELCNIRLVVDNNLVDRLSRLMDAIGMLYMDVRGEHVASLMFNPNPDHRMKYKREWFSKIIRIPFENIEIPAPVNYDEVLKVAYGKDYMTPKKIIGEDYPFYRKMDEEVERQKNR